MPFSASPETRNGMAPKTVLIEIPAYECGHDMLDVEQIQKLVENLRKRNEDRACPTCFKASKRDDNARAAAANKAAGFRPLKGTKAQILWAEQIRHDFATALQERKCSTPSILAPVNDVAHAETWIALRYVEAEDTLLLLVGLREDAELAIRDDGYSPEELLEVLRSGALSDDNSAPETEPASASPEEVRSSKRRGGSRKPQ